MHYSYAVELRRYRELSNVLLRRAQLRVLIQTFKINRLSRSEKEQIDPENTLNKTLKMKRLNIF